LKSRLIFLTLITFISCNPKDSKTKEESTTTELAGIWRFQPEKGDNYRNHQLIFLEDSTFYTFSKSTGGSIIETGYLSKNDSLIVDNGLTYSLKKIDSSTIKIENQNSLFGSFINTSKKRSTKDPRSKLQEFKTIDSIRHKALGWWKLTKTKTPIKLVNYSGTYDPFLLNFKTNGGADFYINNYLDSIVSYGYQIKIDGVNFSRGCIGGSGSQLFFESDSIMKLVMTRRSFDTLELKKIYKIQ
jgi:hypothetical protein